MSPPACAKTPPRLSASGGQHSGTMKQKDKHKSAYFHCLVVVKFYYIDLCLSFCFIVPLCCPPLADNRGGGLAKLRGVHYRSLEPQTVNLPRKVIRSYTPACAKPLVRCWHLYLCWRAEINPTLLYCDCPYSTTKTE